MKEKIDQLRRLVETVRNVYESKQDALIFGITLADLFVYFSFSAQVKFDVPATLCQLYNKLGHHEPKIINNDAGVAVYAEYCETMTDFLDEVLEMNDDMLHVLIR